MFKRLKSYIFQNRGGLNLHTSLVPDPSYTELDDLHVMGVSFKETDDDRILFRAAVQADVIVKGRSRRDYEEDIVYPWFSISFTGILRCGLNMVIKKQILAIRDTGLTNMFDTNMVQRLAYERDFYELVVFIEEHRKEYVHFILYGEA